MAAPQQEQANITTTCHCKAIRLTFPPLSKSELGHALECLCNVCRRYGALWAYYKPEEVEVHVEGDAMEGYVWGKKTTSFNRCKNCGCMTHYTTIPGKREPTVAVNCRMMERKEYDSLETEQSDGDD